VRHTLFRLNNTYTSSNQVKNFIGCLNGAAADFGTQTDTPATGSTDLAGVFTDAELYAKIVVTVGSGALTNCGTPQFQIFGSDTSTVNATSFALSTGVVEISPAVNVTTTVSTSTIYYLPVKSTKKYWQFQLNGTATAAVATGATYTIKMAGLVTSRDGAQSL
jgi:hypothetical protein